MSTVISIADARKRFADLLNKVIYGHESVIITRRGEKVAALVSLEEFALLERIEDLVDIEDAQKALDEAGDNIPAAELWKKLGL